MTLKVLTVGDGDLTLSLALARAYGDKHVAVTASVLDSKEALLSAFPSAPLAELERLHVPILFRTDATQLHRNYVRDHWDLVLFHHPHLGLASLGQDEAKHAIRHHQLICHYLHSATQVSKCVHICLCGTQRETWRLDEAAERQNLTMVREIATAAPFSKIWTDEELVPNNSNSDYAAPRRYRNGKLGSRHFLGKYGYRHRRTAGEQYHGGSSDMNVAGSMHYVFSSGSTETIRNTRSRDGNGSSVPTCSVCGATFSSQKELDDHLKAPAVPQLAELSNSVASSSETEKGKESASALNPEKDITEPPIAAAKSTQASAPNNFKNYELEVNEAHDGKRLRSFLQHNTTMSKRQAEVAIQNGAVLIDEIQALDSSRILKPGMVVTVLSTDIGDETSSSSSLNKTTTIDVSFRQEPFLVVEKPSGMRTKGAIPGALEYVVSQQEGMSYESLSKLDTSCPGLCVMMSQAYLKQQSEPITIQHSLLVLVHGHVPDDWFPQHQLSMTLQRKWKQKKRKYNPEEEAADNVSPPDTSTITIVPLERTDNDTLSGDTASGATSTCLSTICIQTDHPSAASICQWMRQLGFPVVGDMNCRREYLHLKRSIRNRIKNKLCIVCHQVQWHADDSSPGRGPVKVPLSDPGIPDKLSAKYWEENFGAADSEAASQESSTGRLVY